MISCRTGEGLAELIKIIDLVKQFLFYIIFYFFF